MSRILAILLLTVSGAASAYAMSTTFPQGSAELTPQALKSDISGKTFIVQPAQGPSWRWELKDNGYYFVNIGNFSDSGTWSVKGSSLCSAGQKVATGTCNDVRIKDGTLYLKRDNGEVVELQPK